VQIGWQTETRLKDTYLGLKDTYLRLKDTKGDILIGAAIGDGGPDEQEPQDPAEHKQDHTHYVAALARFRHWTQA